MTSPGIQVIPSARGPASWSTTISSPQTAGVPVRGDDPRHRRQRQHHPQLRGRRDRPGQHRRRQHRARSSSPSRNGVWTGPMIFKGAGGAVSITASDFSAPPHTGTSNSFTVNPGPLAGCRCWCPARQARGGTVDGREGTPTTQQAGTPSRSRCARVDQFWNLVPRRQRQRARSARPTRSPGCRRTRGSPTARCWCQTTLYRVGGQRIWADDITNTGDAARHLERHPGDRRPVRATC